MKKRELSVLIAAGMAATLMLGTVQSVKATEYNAQAVNDSINAETQMAIESEVQGISLLNEVELQAETAEAVYLSDIAYDSAKSSAGWGSIKINKNVDGGTIRLINDGNVVSFDKGMGAHATSSLVYNVSAYKGEYNRFVAYAGIDRSKNGYGNGARFQVYTSVDGENWTLVDDLGVLTSNNQCGYIDINLGNANYIKLYAHDNGSNAYDHAVYGDAKLVKANYGGESISSDVLMEVSQYDDILKNATIEENLTTNEFVLLKRDFVSKVGSGTLKRLCATNQEYKNAIEYLLTNEDALRYFVTGGQVNINGNFIDSIKFFSNIYAAHEDEIKDGAEDNFNLRLATSISLAYAHNELTKSWMGGNKQRNAVQRYETYQRLANNQMDKGGDTDGYGKWSGNDFKNLPVALMRWTVDNRMSEDEIEWLADYALKKKAEGKDYLNAYTYINYTSGYNYNRDSLYDMNNKEMYDEKYGFSKYFDDYGTRNVYRSWMAFEEGSVCGGLAKTYSNLADAFGRPSSVVGQPGHAATITYGWHNGNQRYEWMLQNDISGWSGSGNEYSDRLLRWGNDSFNEWHSASYTVLATDAILQKEKFTRAYELNILADVYTDNDKKREIYEEALKVQNINYDSMKGLINTYKADSTKTSKDYLELSRKIVNAYTYYPQAMEELLSLIRVNITGNDLIELDMIENTALTKASKATPAVSTNVTMSKQMAAKYLGTSTSALADFSFDGENAGKIIINSKYDESAIRVKYSLDGGANWAETDDHTIQLSDEEINSITAANDIKVGLVGSNEVYTIDITEGRAMSNGIVYKNDIENLFFGEVDNIQVSTDDCKTWRDYSEILESGERFDGYIVTHVRFKPTGKATYSNPGRYTFNRDNNPDNRKYISVKNISFVEASSYRDNNDRYKAQNLIDGNGNTEWQTQYGDSEKSITVEFDKVRYLTSLEYTTASQYGRLKSGKILTSLDGETWETASVFTNLENTNRNKTINLNVPTAAKYVKLIADETYAGNAADLNKVLSGNMLTFFEDSTKVYVEPVVDEVVEEVEAPSLGEVADSNDSENTEEKGEASNSTEEVTEDNSNSSETVEDTTDNVEEKEEASENTDSVVEESVESESEKAGILRSILNSLKMI